MTNGDYIRQLTDCQLADVLTDLAALECKIQFCQNLPECDDAMETGYEIPAEKCKNCMLHWLQQPVRCT